MVTADVVGLDYTIRLITVMHKSPLTHLLNTSKHSAYLPKTEKDKLINFIQKTTTKRVVCCKQQQHITKLQRVKSSPFFANCHPGKHVD